MSETLSIMFDDLNREAQSQVLEFYGCNRPEDGNFEVVPLFVLQKEEQDREEQ
jgi:hypothetical protein